MEAKAPISTALPTGYLTWAAALADARKSSRWKDAAPVITCWVYHAGTIVGSPEWGVLTRYEKAYLVAQAAIEAESGRQPEGGLNPESMAG